MREPLMDGEWVEPAASNYHGYSLNELPPPSQAWGANLMLNILEACVPKWTNGASLASLGPQSPKYWHLLVEATNAVRSKGSSIRTPGP